MYTIMVAAMGRKVVAIDAMPDNIEYLRKSLNLGNIMQNVTLLNKAIR